MFAITILIASLIPADNVVPDDVDLIELNHLYDKETAELIFDQYIYWDWDNNKWYGGRYTVVDWRLATGKTNMLPRRAAGGGFIQTYWDANDNLLREIRALSFSETWTLHDPELAERDKLPIQWRRRLRK